MIEEIRDEFRRNMVEAGPKQREKMITEAVAGLRALRQQCGLNTDGSEIVYAYDEQLADQR